MNSIVERIRTHIQDPKLTTSMNAFSPRQHSLFPPTTPAIVEAAESELGFRLPPLLRELYSQVANGGFGPGYGIFGLEGGYIDHDVINDFNGGTLVEWYFAFRGKDNRIPELKHEFDFEDNFCFLSVIVANFSWPVLLLTNGLKTGSCTRRRLR